MKSLDGFYLFNKVRGEIFWKEWGEDEIWGFNETYRRGWMKQEDVWTDASVNIKLNVLDGSLTCFVSVLVAHRQRKQRAGSIGLSVKFIPISAKDQRRRENSRSGKEQHYCRKLWRLSEARKFEWCGYSRRSLEVLVKMENGNNPNNNQHLMVFCQGFHRHDFISLLSLLWKTSLSPNFQIRKLRLTGRYNERPS